MKAMNNVKDFAGSRSTTRRTRSTSTARRAQAYDGMQASLRQGAVFSFRYAPK